MCILIAAIQISETILNPTVQVRHAYFYLEVLLLNMKYSHVYQEL